MDKRRISEMMLTAWRNRDWDAIRNVLHRDYVYTGPDGETVSAVEDGLTAGWTSFAESFPDGQINIHSVLVDGDTIVTEFKFSATHTGPFEGIAPTGNVVEIDFCNVMELRDGKVIKERDYFDTLGLMRRLGAAGL